MTVRALVVDDSPTMRALISTLLARDPDIEVIGTAHNAPAARKMIREMDPDVITLDIEMPEMNGLEFLEKIMKLRPMPVVMVSTLTHKGAEASVRALSLGAVECYGKPTGAMRDVLSSDDGKLAEIVKQAGRRKRQFGPPIKAAAPPEDFRSASRIIAVGASTGGVEALMQMLQGFPANCPPTAIVQHMPANFTRALAARLDACSLPIVTEAEDGQAMESGHVYLAPGGERHLMIAGTAARPIIRLVNAPSVSGHCPSVDVLFRSVATTIGENALGVLLTGMGADGAAGLLEMRQTGAQTIGQDEDSCVVYGMPRVAAELGAVDEILPLARIGRRAIQLCSA